MRCPGLIPTLKVCILLQIVVVPAVVTVLFGLCNPPHQGINSWPILGWRIKCTPLMWNPCCVTIGVFCIGKIQGGQDRTFQFWGGIANIMHMVIYPGLGPSLELTTLCPMVWYRRWTCVTWGEQRVRQVHIVKREMYLVPPAWRVGSLL
jgi:hypothetical protein